MKNSAQMVNFAWDRNALSFHKVHILNCHLKKKSYLYLGITGDALFYLSHVNLVSHKLFCNDGFFKKN